MRPTLTINYRIAAVAVLCSLSAACRDGVPVFTPVTIDADTGSFRRLTFNSMPDVNPTWNATSDTVYYTARGFVDFPALAHTMLRLSIDSGPAARLAPDAQPGNANSIMLPVLSPDRASFAYVSLPPMLAAAPCSEPVGQPYTCSNTEPLLVPGFVRIRPIGARGAESADPGVTLPLQGVDPSRAAGGGTPYTQRLFPFQREYNLTTAMLFRPSWASDSRRLVFSDGLMLRLWNTTTSIAAPVPNTADGVSPAWHPAGEQIAFARLIRGDSLRFNCICTEGAASNTPVTHTRWTYTVARNVITLINSDGTGLTELTDGEEPAWSPDGNTLYFVRDHQIYSIPRAGGAPTLLARTLGARSPSVSPDGKWIAFARPTINDTDPDIWILRLGSQ